MRLIVNCRDKNDGIRARSGDLYGRKDRIPWWAHRDIRNDLVIEVYKETSGRNALANARIDER